jgi:ABC-type uncharacterized transport system substrate-binding protein
VVRASLIVYLAVANAWGEAPSGPPRVVVVTSSAVPAYEEALGGLRRGLGSLEAMTRVVELDRKDGESTLAGILTQGRPSVAVAIGTQATDFMVSRTSVVPVISTMILYEPLPPERVVGRISVEVTVPALLQQLKDLFPGKTRLGLIRSPGKAPPPSAVQLRAKQLGFTLVAVEAGGADKLLKTFLSLSGAVDFVWCAPDSSLYNTATFRPLIEASLQKRLPIIGYSEYFARAGAALAVYPDFEDIGSQTAEAVRRFLDMQKAPGDQPPRKLRVALNQYVSRMLELRWSTPSSRETELVIIQ